MFLHGSEANCATETMIFIFFLTTYGKTTLQVNNQYGTTSESKHDCVTETDFLVLLKRDKDNFVKKTAECWAQLC